MSDRGKLQMGWFSNWTTRLALAAGAISSGLGAAVLMGQHLKRAQKRGREFQADATMLRQLFDTRPDGILVVNRQGIILRINAKAETAFGYAHNELVGAPIEILVPIRLQEQHRIDREAYNAAPRARPMGMGRELHARRKDGSEFPIEIELTPMQSDNGPVIVALMVDITARKQAEQTFKEQAALLELAHDAIMVCDLEDRITFWNRGAKDNYGWSAQEALGHVAYDLLRTKFATSFQEIEEVLQIQEEWEGELEHIKRDGTAIVMGSRWSLLRNQAGRPIAVLKINRDVTHRKRDEEQLRNLTERLSLATTTASIGIWELDLRTNQVVWDNTTFAIFGVPRVVPLFERDFNRHVHPEDLHLVEAAARGAIEEKTQKSLEFRIIRPDGAVRYISTVEGPVLDELGNVVRLVGTAVDITERKEIEAQIEAAARLSALGLMAGGVAHEINNPLAIIHTSAANLLGKVKAEGRAPVEIVLQNCQHIEQNSNRIAKIIKSMRYLAREGSQDKVRPAQVSKILEETVQVCEERFKNHSVNLLVPSIDPALSVSCREVQIAQVLLNLLQNALDATEEVGEKWVRIGVGVQDGAVEFSVTDSGPGVPPHLKTKIMEPFFTTKDVGKGIGLGLSLSRRIVEDHGAKLELTEENGHPCFSFRLPLSRSKESHAA